MAKLDPVFVKQVHQIADLIKEINELLEKLESKSIVKFQVASYKDVVPGATDKSHFVIEIYSDKDLDTGKTIHSADFNMISGELTKKLANLKTYEEDYKNESRSKLDARH